MCSNGGVVDVYADLHDLYLIALFPYVMNIPAEQVDLVMSCCILQSEEEINLKAQEMETRKAAFQEILALLGDF